MGFEGDTSKTEKQETSSFVYVANTRLYTVRMRCE